MSGVEKSKLQLPTHKNASCKLTIYQMKCFAFEITALKKQKNHHRHNRKIYKYLVVCSKVFEWSKRWYWNTFFTAHPHLNKIKIVTTFGQQSKRTWLCISPVSTDVRMCEMPVANLVVNKRRQLLKIAAICQRMEVIRFLMVSHRAFSGSFPVTHLYNSTTKRKKSPILIDSIKTSWTETRMNIVKPGLSPVLNVEYWQYHQWLQTW